MKLNNITKAAAFSLLIPFAFQLSASAQNLEQKVKDKKDSIQNAAVNGAIADPLGTATKVLSFFKKKPANAPTTAPATAAPVANVAPAAAPAAVAPVAAPAATAVAITGHSKNINNGLTFTITQCVGDKAAQTVTLTFKLANPNKANQMVVVGSLSQYSSANPGFSIDDNGDKLAIGQITFGGQTGTHITTELPTNITMKGTITLINALPGATSLQYFKLPVASQNAQGAGDKQGILLEDREIPITWAN